MPKGTKDHREKKNTTMHDQWRAHNKSFHAADTVHKLEQKYWRADCLDARKKANKLTARNEKEIAGLLVLD